MNNKFCYISMCLIVFCFLTGCGASKNKEIKNYSFVTNTFSCFGIYQGEVYKGQPSGKGTFVTKDSPKGAFSCSGIWAYGKLNGKGKIEYSDGTVVEGTFKENNLDGEAKRTSLDLTYSKICYKNSQPYGVIYNYDSNGNLKDRDWYYEGIPISQLIDRKIEPTYEDLKENSYSYVNEIIKLKGKIKNIEETENDISYTILTNEGSNYILKYENTEFSDRKQCISPVLDKNDKVVFYGWYEGINKNGLPQIRGVYGCKTEGDRTDNMIDSEFSYDDLVQQPYFYAFEECEMQGKIKMSEKKGNYYYSLFMTKRGEEICFRSSKEIDEKGEIKISGKYYGQYKISDGVSGSFKKYPLVILNDD